MLGIPEPQVAASHTDKPQVAQGRRTWQTRGGTGTLSTPLNPEQKPMTAELVADPSPGDLQRGSDIDPLDDAASATDILQPPGKSKWKGIKKVPAGL